MTLAQRTPSSQPRTRTGERRDGGDSLVISLGDPPRWALVTDVDIAQAAIGRPDATANDLAAPATGIRGEATLIRAIELMREQRTSHLIVTDTESGEPTGMISALDIAGVVGWGEG